MVRASAKTPDNPRPKTATLCRLAATLHYLYRRLITLADNINAPPATPSSNNSHRGSCVAEAAKKKKKSRCCSVNDRRRVADRDTAGSRKACDGFDRQRRRTRHYR